MTAKPIMIADLTRLFEGATRALIVPASARDLRLLDDWRRLDDTPPPLTVQGFSLHGQFPFEPGDLVEVRDLLGRRALTHFTTMTLLTIATLTDAQISELGYLRRDQVPDFGGRRIWYVGLQGMERLPDEPPPDAASVETRHGDSGTVERRTLSLRDSDTPN